MTRAMNVRIGMVRRPSSPETNALPRGKPSRAPQPSLVPRARHNPVGLSAPACDSTREIELPLLGLVAIGYKETVKRCRHGCSTAHHDQNCPHPGQYNTLSNNYRRLYCNTLGMVFSNTV